MEEAEIKGIEYYAKIKKLESFNKLRYLYKLHISDFYNKNIKHLEDIGIKSKKNQGLGLLIINITKINPEKIDCFFYPTDKIPDELEFFKKKITEDKNNNNTLYFYFINRNTTMFLTKII
jgi:hypothetical protein